MTIKFRSWIIVAEKLSSSREELDIDLYKILGIFISKIQKNADYRNLEKFSGQRKQNLEGYVFVNIWI